MKVAEISSLDDWARLQPLWNPLLASSASGTTFLTWECLWPGWAAYGSSQDLRILTFADDEGTIRGIARLRRQTLRKYGASYSALAFLGDGSNDSDYLDFI